MKFIGYWSTRNYYAYLVFMPVFLIFASILIVIMGLKDCIVEAIKSAWREAVDTWRMIAEIDPVIKRADFEKLKKRNEKGR